MKNILVNYCETILYVLIKHRFFRPIRSRNPCRFYELLKGVRLFQCFQIYLDILYAQFRVYWYWSCGVSYFFVLKFSIGRFDLAIIDKISTFFAFMRETIWSIESLFQRYCCCHDPCIQCVFHVAQLPVTRPTGFAFIVKLFATKEKESNLPYPLTHKWRRN